MQVEHFPNCPTCQNPFKSEHKPDCYQVIKAQRLGMTETPKAEEKKEPTE
jgi:hypothetical protein